MGWELVGLLLVIAALDLAVRIASISIIVPIFERKPLFNVRQTAPDPAAEEVWFPTTHGLTLRGSLYRHEDRPARGLVIFCPEMSGSHWSAMSYCEGLYRAGFDIFAFDFRNQGDSDHLAGYDPLHWITEYEVADVLAALSFARERNGLRHLPVGLFGISRGGGAALIAGARSRDIRCIACEGAFATATMQEFYAERWAALFVPAWVMRLVPRWHLRQTIALARWVSQLRRGVRYVDFQRWLPLLRGRPVLMVADGADTYVNPEIPRRMARRIGGSQLRLWHVPGAKHNQARHLVPDEYDSMLAQFFSVLSPQLSAVREARPVDQSDPLIEKAGMAD